jgi:hypothetical protein
MYVQGYLQGSENSRVVTIARLNETRFGPKKMSSPIYLGPEISTLFDEIAR